MPTLSSSSIIQSLVLVLRSSFIMRVNFIMLGFALAGISSALPTEDTGEHRFLSELAVSPDNTCGNVFAGANNSYTCDATVNSGGSCSQYGNCASASQISWYNAYSMMKDIVEIQQTIVVRIVELPSELAHRTLLQGGLAVQTMEERFARPTNAAAVSLCSEYKILAAQ